MEPAPLQPGFVLADLCLLVGLALALRVRLAARKGIGAALQRSAAGGGWRWLGLGVVGAAAVCAVLGREELGLDWTLPLVGLTAALCFLAPRGEDRVCGSRGVRRGWYVRRYEELEEWRLVGDHLRFRLRGRWEAVPCAPERQPEVEARLRAVAPERESPFQ